MVSPATIHDCTVLSLFNLKEHYQYRRLVHTRWDLLHVIALFDTKCYRCSVAGAYYQQ